MQYLKIIWFIFIAALFVAFTSFMCSLGLRPILIGTEYSPQTKVEVFSRNDFVMFSGDAGVYAALVIAVVLIVLIGVYGPKNTNKKRKNKD